LSRFDIKAELPLRIPWDEWVIELFNESFVEAWIADVDYQLWQNSDDVRTYESFGRPVQNDTARSGEILSPTSLVTVYAGCAV
jgi:hypothetical protein